jgi:hypothetical protein
MAVAMGIDTDILREWLQSRLTARICGLDLRPKPSPYWEGAPQCITKGQASVTFFEQVPQGHTWLIKIFTPGRRPTDEYLLAVESCLPGTAAFFTCTQRRLLTRGHVDLRASSYRNPALADLLEGAIMMPKVPGTPWGAVADDLREGTLQMSLAQRLKLSLALAQCIDILEAGQCSHRDLSATNVFVDKEGRVWLIDWDCTYHRNLPFQGNTTVGTMGYVAPFLRVGDGHPDPAWSWCPCADRFALAVLVTEILLTGPDLAPHEDGTLFSQAQIDEPGNRLVREMIGRLRDLSRPCGLLLERAFASSTFQECPSPQEWIGALKGTLRRSQTGANAGGQGQGQRQFVWVLCAKCGLAFSIAQAKYDDLRQKDRPSLCADCLSSQFRESSLARAQHRLDFPEVSCEHCQERFSLPRHRLDDLRHRGRPLLCPACLPTQLKKWHGEQAQYDCRFPRVACGLCGRQFRLAKERLQALASQGKTVLCRPCLGMKHQEHETKDRAGEQGSALGRTIWDFVRRIWYGHST